MKNRLKLVLMIFSMMSFAFITAQEYFFGIKGGVNLNTIGTLRHLGTSSGGGTGVTPTTNFIYNADKEMGTQFGAFAVVDFGRFFIRPEYNISSVKNSYPLALRTSNWTAKRTDIDILIGTHLNDYFSFYAGPVYTNYSEFQLEGVEAPIIYDKNPIGVSLGVLAEYGRFGLDFRYELGINEVKEQRIDMVRTSYGTNVGYLEAYKPSMLSINFTIKLFGYDPEGTVKEKRSSYDWRNHKNLR